MWKMISKDNVDFFFKRFLNYCEESEYSIMKSRSANHYCTIGSDNTIIAFYNKNENAVELNFTETLKTKCNDTGVFTFMCGVVENFIMAGRFYRVKVKSNKTKIEKDFEGLQKVIRTKVEESLKYPDDIRLSSVYTNEDDLTEQTGIVKPIPTQSYFFVDTEGKFNSRLIILFDYKTKTIALSNSDYYKRRMFESACKENPNFTKIFDVLKESIDEYFFKS